MDKINLKQVLAEIADERKNQDSVPGHKLTQDEIRQMLKSGNKEEPDK